MLFNFLSKLPFFSLQIYIVLSALPQAPKDSVKNQKYFLKKIKNGDIYKGTDTTKFWNLYETLKRHEPCLTLNNLFQ